MKNYSAEDLRKIEEIQAIIRKDKGVSEKRKSRLLHELLYLKLPKAIRLPGSIGGD